MGTLPRVLVVDDDPTVQMNLRAYLEDEGFTVLSASSGEDALDLLMEKSPPDLAVLDIRLTGMSGEELVLRAREIVPKLRFLIHTGSTEYIVPRTLSELGVRAQDVLVKPVADTCRFREAINNLLIREDQDHEG